MTLERERPHFTMVPLSVLFSDLSAQAVRLYAVLDHHSGRKASAWPSRATLAEEMACTEKTVDRAVRDLVDHGLLVVERQAGVRGVNRYRLQMRARKQPSTTSGKSPLAVDKNATLTSGKNDTQTRRSEQEPLASACPLCEGQGWQIGDGNVARVCECRQETA